MWLSLHNKALPHGMFLEEEFYRANDGVVNVTKKKKL
jgi:hypothetical protein